MLPIAVDLSKVKIAFIGEGKEGESRLKKLCEARAENISRFDHNVTKEQLQSHQLVLIVGVEDEVAFDIAEKARSLGALVNVEDRKDYCDFFYSSVVRRGDLLFAINTGGKSPALSVRIRKILEKLFPENWAERLDELGQKRTKWKKEKLGFSEITKKTNEYIDNKNWLNDIENV